MVQLPFVGRVHEQRSYQALLTGAASPCWLLVITGQGGNGKSTLLRRLAKNTPQNIPVFTLNFATSSLRNDQLAILDDLAEQGKAYCDARRVDLFWQALHAGRSELAKPRDVGQTINVYDHGVMQGNQLTISANEQRRQVHEQVSRAFYHMLETFQPTHLVLMLDTCEWFNEPESMEVGQWLLNGLLPGIHKRFNRRQRCTLAVLASRLPLQLDTIDMQEQQHLALPLLDEQAVADYLRQIGVQDAALHRHVYKITYGHALCVAIIATLWQEQPFALEDLPVLQGRFTERTLFKLIDERVLDKRLKAPFRALTRYSTLLRSFNLPMLQTVFPDLKLDHGQFRQFIRYPYVESRGPHRYAIHDLVRVIIAESIREQEPQQWQACHERALENLTQTSQGQLDQHYHAIALAQDQGMSEWEEAIQNASLRGPREVFATLLQIAQDQTLRLIPENRALCMQWQGRFYYYEGQMQAALQSYEQALGLYRQVGARLGEANCCLAQGRAALQQDDHHNALKLHTSAYQLYQQIQDGYSQARLLYYRSFVYEAMQEQTLALQDVNDALVINQQLGLPLAETLQWRLDTLDGLSRFPAHPMPTATMQQNQAADAINFNTPLAQLFKRIHARLGIFLHSTHTASQAVPEKQEGDI